MSSMCADSGQQESATRDSMEPSSSSSTVTDSTKSGRRARVCYARAAKRDDQSSLVTKEGKANEVQPVSDVLLSSSKCDGADKDEMEKMSPVPTDELKRTTDDDAAAMLSADYGETGKGFLCQPWAALREMLGLSETDFGINAEDAGSKAKEQKKAVLPHTKYPIYGFCPARDEFIVVKCSLCGLAVKPVAHRAHMQWRHNIGMKSPEPTTPVLSVISPAFPSDLSSSQACSNVETVPIAHKEPTVDTVPIKSKLPSKPVKRANLSTKKPSITITKETLEPAGANANYVVVAPHSSGGPLKLTFRRAQPNVSIGAPSPTPTPASAATVVSKSDKKLKESVSKPVVPTMDNGQRSQLPQISSAVQETTVTAVPSTSTASSVESSTSSIRAMPVVFAAPTAPIVSTNVPNHVYEHPRPLALCRLAQRSSTQQQIDLIPQSSQLGTNEDQTCFLLTSYSHNNHRRWPTFRRLTDSIRQACQHGFDDSGGPSGAGQQTAAVLTVIGGGMEQRPKGASADGGMLLGKLIPGTTAGQQNQQRNVIYTSTSHRSSPVTIVRPSGSTNSRLTRLPNSLRKLDVGYRQQMSSPVVMSGGGMYNVGGSSTNKMYTRVSINRLKSTASDNETAQMPVNLGSLVCNGNSHFESTGTTTVLKTIPKRISGPRKSSIKRPTQMDVYPTSLINTMGSQSMSAVKKPRLHSQVGDLIEVEEVSSIDAGGMIISETELKPSINHENAKHQLIKALQQARNSNSAVRRRQPQSHQSTPMVISPSQTPHHHQQQQPAQVVLVSVNGPAVLTGWQKFTTNAGTTGMEDSAQSQSGFIRNGLTGSAVVGATMPNSACTGTRILRPKMTSGASSQSTMLMAHSEDHRAGMATGRQRGHVQGLLAQPGSGHTANIHTAKQSTQTRFGNTTGAAIGDVSMLKIAQQQQQQLPVSGQHKDGTTRATAVSSTPVLATPIVLSVAAVTKGGSNAHTAATLAPSTVKLLSSTANVDLRQS